ncbi:protein FAM193A-like isoform X1 [Mytilus californianus]|uniref:protein FAM193A-like isoform X1 n=1 Tax=Mytilus californianus TaxID=6549 RepID=UPI002247FAD7|nr:protein FAM193A-like isoform X1 [Mytilus californianus]
MSAADDKKAKRRKIKKSLVAKNLPRSSTFQNGTEASNLSNSPSETILSPAIDSETLRRLEKLMDASDDADSLELLSLSRGPNPYLDKERCLLCGCERQDPPEAAAYKMENSDCEKRAVETNLLTQLPLWVCPECRKSTDQEMEKKMSSNITGFMDPDLPPEPSSPPFLPEAALRFSSPPNTSNGSMCSCDACKEMREIEAQHDLETQELQNCWTVLRKLVRVMYGRREEDITPDNDTPNEEEARELVDRLCTRDPHQLFLRLESQVREFVIEMKVKLLKQLNSGYKTPPEAKAFISLLLDEYCHLCGVSRKMSEILTKLKTDHLAKFNVTWELHNKHLFQSIAYTEPSIQSSLHLIITQLRMGAASKESYNEDTYPNLLHRYLKFDDEMSVISVVWRDSQQLIEQYNEEQAALKLKQKMLKEDWEFFKAQRTILEQQVAKNDQPLPPHNFEQQFTETMRMMLQGTKPSQEECHCPRCNRKRCPCDECTITHMITCGIINPEALEDQENSSHINFLHDPNRYRIDVSPPSMSSTTSSSGSSSPIMVDHERLTLPFDETGDRNTEEIPEEIEGNSQSDIDDEEEDDDYDDEDDDEDEEDDDEEDEEEEDDDDGDNENEDEIDNEDKNDGLEEQIDNKSISDLSSSWPNDDEGAEELINSEKCDCYHCVSQAKAEQMIKVEENQCQCYVCLRQQGKAVSTSLPQQVAPTSQPGELHLYPHIHGSAGLHGFRSHVRPLLQPQLYDLHMPLRQPKPLIQSPKVPLKLDFDSPDGIHEHIYHAYGDWDNTYDSRMMLSNIPKYGHGLGSELLPAAPLTTNYTTNFLTEPFSVSTQTGMDTVMTSTSPSTSSFRTTTSVHTSLATTQANSDQTASITNNHLAISSVQSISQTLSSTTTNCSKNSATPPCTRPVTLGGNIPQQPVLSEKLPAQPRKRQNAANSTNVSPVNHSNGGISDKVTQDFIQTAARNIREGAKEGMQMIRQFANSLNANVNTHTCNHNCRNSQNVQSCNEGPPPGCRNAVALPSSVNNVSVGTSTVCMEPDCEGHCDENGDGIDDSCSEQSSTNSSQKDGKYCDCCYCEFFGHGNPPQTPTSKNYAEMRDRLRLRLKKKVGNQSDTKHKDTCSLADHHMIRDQPLEDKGSEELEELLHYINGTDNHKEEQEDKQLSAKAAKRARQKQRKAEEKARLEAEKLHHEKLEREKELAKNLINAAKIEESKNEKKRRKKRKQVEEIKQGEIKNGCDKREDPNLVRVPPLGREDTDNKVKNNVKLQVKLSDAPLKSPSTEIQKTVKIVKTDPVKTQRIIVEPLQTNGKVNLKAIKKPDLLKSSPVQPKLQVTKGASQSSLNSAKPVPEQTTKSSAKRKDNKNEKDVDTTEKRMDTGDVKPRKGKSVHNNNDIVVNKNIVQLNGNNNNKTVKKTATTPTPPKPSSPPQQIKSSPTSSPSSPKKADTQKTKAVVSQSPPQDQQPKGGKKGKNKKKNRNSEDLSVIDEIFLPKSESDLENGELDETEKELEAFKRFCLDYTPVTREKLQVNMNIKDIFVKKKSGLSCT